MHDLLHERAVRQAAHLNDMRPLLDEQPLNETRQRHASAASQILERLAAEEALFPDVLNWLRDEILAALNAADSVLQLHGCKPGPGFDGLAAFAIPDDAARVEAVRARMAESVRALAALPGVDQRGSEPELAFRQLGLLDGRWRTLAEQALADTRMARRSPIPDAGKETPDTGPRATPALLTAYLRRTFPDLPAIEATDVRLLTGGYSKWTMLVSLRGTDALPAKVVMRQDVKEVPDRAGNVIDEYGVLEAVRHSGAAVPATLHIERSNTELGCPFMLVTYLPHQPIGSYNEGFRGATTALGIDIAQTLGKLHGLDPTKVPARARGTEKTLQAQMIAEVEQLFGAWRDVPHAPSALVETAFALLLSEYRKSVGPTVVVHGDVNPGNILVTPEGRLSALLDWETAHLGDPAEDLGYCRQFIEPIMPWSVFMANYRAAGGPEVSERSILMGTLRGLARNAAWSVAGVHQWRSGQTDDFMFSTHGILTVPGLEAVIAQTLLRIDALDNGD